MRVIIAADPFHERTASLPWHKRGLWPCFWISCPDSGPPPFVTAYRRQFLLSQAATIRVHVSADERYELFLDGKQVGRGPERGHPRAWNFESYDLTLSEGSHCLVARIWSLGDAGPYAQMSVRPGFLLAPQEEEYFPLLGTGVAPWEAKKLEGCRWNEVNAPGYFFAVGADLEVDEKCFPWGFERGEGDGWAPVAVGEVGSDAAARVEAPEIHFLTPAMLPEMVNAEYRKMVPRLVTATPPAETRETPMRQNENLVGGLAGFHALLAGDGVCEIQPHSNRRILIELDDYLCAYPSLTVSGGAGAMMRVSWAEALFETPDGEAKGRRDEIEGKYFLGIGDTFWPDGGEGRCFDTLWWRCGRFIEISIATVDSPLTIESFVLEETRYPLEAESQFQSDHADLDAVLPLARRALQMCAHETYMDCPYYEQLMYAGDTRLQMLTTYVLTRDDRLPRKALQLFDHSRLLTGLTQSRFPTRVSQVIPPFSLWWVASVYDYALWRGDRDFVSGLMSGVRAVLDFFARARQAGLVESPAGWNFADWVPSWSSGIPPAGDHGTSALLNWQFVGVLEMAARLETWLEEPELCSRWRRIATETAAACQTTFWNSEHGLFADEKTHQHFSEHTQCLALLSGRLDRHQAAVLTQQLAEPNPALQNGAEATIYFSHYLFEALAQHGRFDAAWRRLSLWFDLLPTHLKTTPEQPEPTRSDCHGWGAHPLYHAFASIAEIRPATLGFQSVEIRPHLASIGHIQSVLPHPSGLIEAELKIEDGQLRGSVKLPPGISGTFWWAGTSQEFCNKLYLGENTFPTGL